MLSLQSSSWQSLPENPGVYLFRGENEKILYVGKAVNLRKRVSSYFNNRKLLGEKTGKLVSEIKKIFFIPVESEIEALLLEANLIKKYQPKYNVNFKDGKAYPFIKITVSEEYPRITTSRRIENEKDLFFGPYPDGKTLYFLLKTIRRIFPYRSCRKIPKKACLYYYLNLCPGFCIFQNPGIKMTYQKTIKNIKLFLEAKKRDILRILETEMKIKAEKENFEEAQKIKEKIEKIREILSPPKKPFEYLKNPNLLEDLRKNELLDLKNKLNQWININIRQNFRIEGYDISNILGTTAVGSMVVFLNGNPDKKQYRRFKINYKEKPNDLKMIEEVIKRRIRHKDWIFPSLFIVDGGESQVNTFFKVLRESKIPIPVIGWAKNTENFYLAKINFENIKKIKIPQNTPAYLLLVRIVKEAHRFAHQYYSKLKEKMLLLN